MSKIMFAVPPSGATFSQGNAYVVSKSLGMLHRPYTPSDFDDIDSAVAGQAAYSSSSTTFSFPNEITDESSCVSIFAGAKPSQTEFDSLCAAGTVIMNYASSRLLTFNNNIDAKVDTDQSNNQFLVTLSSDTVTAALRSGIAGWWLYHDYHYSTDSVGGAYEINVRMGSFNYCGDVSLSGGAGELQMADTNIVAGQNYMLTAFTWALAAHLTIT